MPIKIYQKCNKCSGTGMWSVEQGVDVTCPDCAGAKRLELCEIDSVFTDNVFHSYKVFEATDLTEYNALTDAQKERYQLILGMGQVDLNDGSNAFDLLKGMFGPSTTTRANLLALLA